MVFWDELFRLPFATGLVLALLLPLLGCVLRLRQEWLAALGIAQVAACGQLLGAALAWPFIIVVAATALLSVVLKYFFRQEGNAGYAVMMLLGWAVLYLLAANVQIGEALSHALAEGQILFSNAKQLYVLLIVAVMLALLWRYWQNNLLRAVFFPVEEKANALPAWRWQISFDVMVAIIAVLATSVMGLMATFALVFISARSAFLVAKNWRQTLCWAAGLGVLAYMLAFQLALTWDQPFGPVLVASTLIVDFSLRVCLKLVHVYRVSTQKTIQKA
jgi:zinc/manganese transport system permease protein